MKSNHQRLRSNVIEGQCTHVPQEGDSFFLFAVPLESGSFRLVNTSPVLLLSYDEKTRTFMFTTKNSEYFLEVLEADKNPMDYTRFRPV